MPDQHAKSLLQVVSGGGSVAELEAAFALTLVPGAAHGLVAQGAAPGAVGGSAAEVQ